MDLIKRISDSKRKRSNSDIHRHPAKTLTRLISHECWFVLEMTLHSSKPVVIDDTDTITAETILHFALRFGAPLTIIKLLAKRYPQGLTSVDTTGKLALHVACKYGATPGVILFLIEKNKEAAHAHDTNGKCPIHYVAEFYPTYDESDSMNSNRMMLEVTKILREAAPESFNLEDNNGVNAIELAIEHDADLHVIKNMQRTAMNYERDMAKREKEHQDDENLVSVHRPRMPARRALSRQSASMRHMSCSMRNMMKIVFQD